MNKSDVFKQTDLNSYPSKDALKVANTNQTTTKLGIITNCLKLIIRKEPSFNADVVCTIPCLSEVMVEESESTDDFYMVCTESGAEGYCVKKYVILLSEEDEYGQYTDID